MNTSSQEKTTKAFFQLLRIAIGNENAFSYYLMMMNGIGSGTWLTDRL